MNEIIDAPIELDVFSEKLYNKLLELDINEERFIYGDSIFRTEDDMYSINNSKPMYFYEAYHFLESSLKESN